MSVGVGPVVRRLSLDELVRLGFAIFVAERGNEPPPPPSKFSRYFKKRPQLDLQDRWNMLEESERAEYCARAQRLHEAGI